MANTAHPTQDDIAIIEGVSATFTDNTALYSV